MSLAALCRVVVASGLAALATAACARGGSGNGVADQSFLAAVHVGAPDIATYRSDVQLVRLGHAACDAFRSGASYQQLADRMALLEGHHSLPSQDLGIVITSAVDAYCPQFHAEVS